MEELFSRYTDQALKLVLHFTDVHQRNIDKALCKLNGMQPFMDVRVYQKRYLQMILTIMSRSMKNEAYLASKEFFKDLFYSFHCEQAIQMAVVHFVSTIKYYQQGLEANNIAFNIVEYDPNRAELLKKTYQDQIVGKELSELNKAIHQTKNDSIKQSAIAVRERLLDLYDNGTPMSELVPLITATTNLLTVDSG